MIVSVMEMTNNTMSSHGMHLLMVLLKREIYYIIIPQIRAMPIYDQRARDIRHEKSS